MGVNGQPPFERVVRAHGPALLRFCAMEVGAGGADDCFQETMLAALRSYGDLRDAASARSWLFAIAARKALDAHRASARAPLPVHDIAAVAGAAEPAHRDQDLWLSVRGLPHKQRQAVTLRYLGDLTHREIATVMGISEAAVRRNVFEGLERLRRQA